LKIKPLGLALSVILLFIVLPSGFPPESSRGVGAALGLPDHKVVAAPGLLSPGSGGIVFLQDYGSYRLYRLTDGALASLPPEIRNQIILADDMDRIMIEAYPFNSQASPPTIPNSLSMEQVTGPALQLIQFVGPIKAEWLKAVEARGAVPVHYIANNAYLVWANDAGRSQLSRLASTGDFLQYSAPFQPYFKLGASIRDRLANQTGLDQLIPVDIQLYRNSGMDASERLIKKLSLRQLSPWNRVLDFENISVAIHLADIPLLANQPDVYWIGEKFERQLTDEVQDQILAANFDASQSGPSSPGYLTWLTNQGFSLNPNDYLIVDITDDGIGNGTVNSGDPTLYEFGNMANPSRLAYIQNCTSATDAASIGGHGHLNTSIVGGYDNRPGSPYEDLSGFNLGLGVNPFGRMAGTRIFTETSFDLSSCGNTDTGVIRASYIAGARISSNSWGCEGCAGTYDTTSQAYDVGVRDADLSQPGNQQFIIVFSAGNGGPNSSTVSTPGDAKNVITVGASESDRPTWTDGCAIGPDGADNAMDVISFSGRGPASGNRRKPEVVAPGTHIQGTASTSPAYDGSSVCDPYQPSGQTSFAASSGTSHSAPAVAGIASLFDYWLKHAYGLANPSPAIIKAYLIAHPTYLTGMNANDTLPSNSQGYGMPDLSLAFDKTPRELVDQSVVFNNSGDTWRFDGVVADPNKPLRIVLAYTDQAGAIGTSPQVNNLNLQAVVGGTSYLGNHFAGEWSTPGGSPDSTNNYEAVFLPPGTSGSVHVTITGFNIAGDGVPNSGDSTDQDFALVCYNCSKSPDFNLIPSPKNLDVCSPANADYQVSVGQNLGFSDPVTLSASGLPAGTQLSFDVNPVIPPGTSKMTISNTASASPGSYQINITGMSPTSTHSSTVGLNLFNLPPGQPVLLTPSDGAGDQAIRPVFSWSAPAQGLTYDLEIAADSAFSDIVISATGLLSTDYLPGMDLNTSGTYYWRVRSRNPCGMSLDSAIYSFTVLSAPGDCSPGTKPRIIYQNNFESGMDSWLHGGDHDTWALSNSRAHSGQTALKATDLPYASNQQLFSPPFTLPTGQQPLTLKFWNYQSIEKSWLGNICYDGAILEISTDGGATWTQMESQLLTDPYDGPIYASFGNPLPGKNAWCGDPQDWLNSIVDLNAYAGKTVQFRFSLGTDSSFGVEGWYIDDVVVQSCRPEGYLATLGPDSLRTALPGARVTHDFTLQNLGLTDNFSLTLQGYSWPAVLLASSPISLTSGASITVSVQVEVPPLMLSTLQDTDSFTLTAVSANNPGEILSARGTTDMLVIPGVSVSPLQSGRAGPPGSTLTHTFTISNTGNYTDTYNLKIAGNKWPTTAPTQTTQLGPGESAVINVPVEIPGEPILHKVIVSDTFMMTADSTLDPNRSAQSRGITYANVLPGISLFPSESARFGKLGETVTSTFLITNTGNYTDTFILSSTGQWNHELSTLSTGSLGPGDSTNVDLRVAIPATAASGETQVAKITAMSTLDKTIDAAAYAHITSWWLVYSPFISQNKR
jgi:hypothetical protein